MQDNSDTYYVYYDTSDQGIEDSIAFDTAASSFKPFRRTNKEWLRGKGEGGGGYGGGGRVAKCKPPFWSMTDAAVTTGVE
jgi:hypothetical protein